MTLEQLLTQMLAAFAVSIPTIAICVFAGVARTIVQESKRSTLAFLTSIILSVFVGILATKVAKIRQYDDEVTFVVCAVCAFIAEDILSALKFIGQKIRQNPLEFLRVLLNKGSGSDNKPNGN
jgi:uncharacterized membrane protein